MQVTVKQNKSLGNYESLTIEFTDYTGDSGMDATTLVLALRAAIARLFDRQQASETLLHEAYIEQQRINTNVAAEFNRLNDYDRNAGTATMRRADQMRMSMIRLGHDPRTLDESEASAVSTKELPE